MSAPLNPQQFPETGEYGRVPMSTIRAHAKGVSQAYMDNTSGRPSRTVGPIEVTPTEHGDLQLTDGYHRYADMLLHSHPSALVRVASSTDHVVADEETRHRYAERHGGLGEYTTPSDLSYYASAKSRRA